MSDYCIVTGGAGYVGSHFCKALASAGFVPVSLDNLCRGHRELVKWGPFVHGDIRDRVSLDALFDKYRPVAVFHFAGLTYVGESVEKPDIYYDNNFCGAKSLLDAMAAHSCRNIVFSSTAATYGIPHADRIDENHAQWPINPYGWSKLLVERMLMDYSSAYGLNFAALRYFNACGADADGETGELHDPETHLIPLIIQTALGIRADIKIFGSDYPTPDGSAVRDYIHVTDLASAHIKAMQHIIERKEDICLNLGTGKGYSVKEVINAVRRVTGTDFPVMEADRRAGDPPVLVASSDAAQTLLGWDPVNSDIDNIIATAFKWHKSRRTSQA